MNYIHELQADNTALTERIDSARTALTDLLVYLNSEKFRCGNTLDGYVNVRDVIARMEPAVAACYR